jgi:hypothetical protein
MLGVTLFGLALTPVFYWSIRKLSGGRLEPGRFAPRPGDPAEFETPAARLDAAE